MNTFKVINRGRDKVNLPAKLEELVGLGRRGAVDYAQTYDQYHHFTIDSGDHGSPTNAVIAFWKDYERHKVPEGGKIYWRIKPEMSKDMDFSADKMTYRMIARFTLEIKW